MKRRYEDIQTDIERIEIRFESVSIFFKDKLQCFIPLPHTDSLYCRVSCKRTPEEYCHVIHEDFVILWEGVISKYLGHECILVPDWISKIFENSRGLEEKCLQEKENTQAQQL